MTLEHLRSPLHRHLVLLQGLSLILLLSWGCRLEVVEDCIGQELGILRLLAMARELEVEHLREVAVEGVSEQALQIGDAVRLY